MAKEIQLLAATFEKLKTKADVPALSSTASSLLDVCQNSRSTIEDIAAIVRLDPGLTTQFLHLANTAFYGRPAHVAAIEDALLLLGVQEVKRFSAFVSIMSTGLRPERKAFPYLDFWKHSLLTARLTELIASVAKVETGGEYLAGLLHDIGKLFVACYFEKQCQAICEASEHELSNWCEVEGEMSDMNHAEVGFVIAQAWGLREDIRLSILYHHNACSENLNQHGKGGKEIQRLAQYVAVASNFAHSTLNHREIDLSVLVMMGFCEKLPDDVVNDFAQKSHLKWIDAMLAAITL